jgi:prephenate dehydrogenase
MGGSLALALRGRCAALLGIDPDPSALSLAEERRVVDRASSHPEAILPEADVVIIAAPVGAILQLVQDLPDLHPGSPVVLDLGSTKAQVCQAYETLPSRFDPVGGHPMCGREVGTLANADPGLYRGAPFAFTPLARTTPRARSLVEQLARAAGARPLWLDPATHDRWVAATSHLPYLLASALASATPAEAAPLAGPGFRSASRLAATPAKMMLDVLATNQADILEALRRFRQELDHLEDELARGEFGLLLERLERSAAHQGEITGSQRRGDEL